MLLRLLVEKHVISKHALVNFLAQGNFLLCWNINNGRSRKECPVSLIKITEI